MTQTEGKETTLTIFRNGTSLFTSNGMQCPRTCYTVLDTLICKSLDTDFVLPLVWVVHFA